MTFKNIQEENKIIFVLSDSCEIDDITEEEINLINQAPIKIKGKNNTIKIKVKDRKKYCRIFE